MGRFKSINDVWNFLNSIPMFSKVGDKATNFGLENISRFCEKIGNPQNQFKSIHVAGTNGKGTTCYLLEAVYHKAGFKTGIFISPHLLKYNERVRISGEEVKDQTILEFFQKTELVLQEIPLTYFEISTALSFWIFAKENIDIAIIETGLGGRLDSTNIIQPELSIITSIGKDHEKILGDSIEKIAFEKAGIIKKNIPVVVGNLDLESMKVVEEKVNMESSVLFKSSDLKPVYNLGMIFLGRNKEDFKTKLIEPVNAWNIAMVYLAVEVLNEKFQISKSALKDSIENFKGVPARFEKLHHSKQWFFSGSHNEQAIDAMMDAVNRIPSFKKVLILSMMKDKLKTEILSKFTRFDEVFFYEQDGERAATFSDVEEYISARKIDENTCKMILNELNTELVIFAGSFYFYSTVKRWLTENTERN
tara:strand:- start:40761 stop:42020 length:1260 start_codon:yes stop_codon:yes gene_type:complete